MEDLAKDTPDPNEWEHLIAHSVNEFGREQPFLEHSGNVARRAGLHASAFDSGHFGEWNGWWHDAGKVADDIQKHLRAPRTAERGPDHSSAGMLRAMEVCHPLAFNIAGHHGGLPNYCDLKERVRRKSIEPDEQRVRDALKLAEKVLSDHAPTLDLSLMPQFLKAKGEMASKRRLEVWIRMLHSALVDADCIDTEAHFNSERNAERERARPSIEELWGIFEKKQNALLTCVESTTLNSVRLEIYRRCIEMADQPQGIFSLTVPTGGGKTRSALGFALRHAVRHGLRRVIVVLPYTSIIEQNADVYRDILGSDAVLEHHSAAQSSETPEDVAESERRQRMAAENWDVPVVVTTSVQLLESLFANRNSRVRKLHNIVKSVLVLDEIQTLPPALLEPTLDMLRHLSEAYGVTVLLCTATQPAFTSDLDFEGFEEVTEILSNPGEVYQKLKRVRYRIDITEPWPWNRIVRELCSADQSMVIMNTVKDALRLLEELRGEEHVFHLSANLCGHHRRKVLAEVRERLKNGLPVRLVATQVVEAGVDIDFPLVLRALGPLDSIIQAAGRCNREGRLAEGEVVVFIPLEGGCPPGAYKLGKDQTHSMLQAFSSNRLHDYTFPTEYFRRLYDISKIDERDIQGKRARFEFVETSKAYRLIDDEQTPVIVPYGVDIKLDELIRKIEKRKEVSRSDWRLLQPYLVNLRKKRLKEALDSRVCREIAEGLYLLDDMFYDPIRGVSMDRPGISELIIDA